MGLNLLLGMRMGLGWRVGTGLRMGLELPAVGMGVKITDGGNSLAVQWLGLLSFTAEGQGSIPGWGTKIPQAMQ